MCLTKLAHEILETLTLGPLISTSWFQHATIPAWRLG